MTFYNLASDCVRALNETTTMSSISFLPTEVGAVQSAIRKLGKKKGQWNLEILEGDNETTVRFEDALEIKVPVQYWDDFQRIFDGALSNNAYLELASVELIDSVKESEEALLEQRIAEVHKLVENQLKNPALQKVDTIVRQWISQFDNCAVTNELDLIPLPIVEGWKDTFVSELIEDHKEDLGQLEILLENLQDFRRIQECAYLAGGQITCQCEGIELIFEAHTKWDNVNTFSIVVCDDEVADAVEESVIDVPRIGNMFFPRGGQMDVRLGSENFINMIKEAIYSVVSGDENNEADS